MDNNLLWRCKAYTFGHFKCNLCGNAAHVQHTSSPFSHQRRLLITARDIDLYNSVSILTGEHDMGQKEATAGDNRVTQKKTKKNNS